jgi:hypothetical protein
VWGVVEITEGLKKIIFVQDHAEEAIVNPQSGVIEA